MWVFDGETWIDEGASPGEVKRPADTSRFEEFYPELQVIEITPVLPRTNHIPFPLPTP